MGLTVTDQGPFPDPDVPADMVFMSYDPAEHHHFVLAAGRPDDEPFHLTQQLSFMVANLDELRCVRYSTMTAAEREAKMADLMALTH